MFYKLSVAALLALAPFATIAHYNQVNDPDLTYY